MQVKTFYNIPSLTSTFYFMFLSEFFPVMLILWCLFSTFICPFDFLLEIMIILMVWDVMIFDILLDPIAVLRSAVSWCASVYTDACVFTLIVLGISSSWAVCCPTTLSSTVSQRPHIYATEPSANSLHALIGCLLFHPQWLKVSRCACVTVSWCICFSRSKESY